MYCLFSLQFSVASLVLSYLLPKGSQAKWMVASGLLQISEYAFVLGSRARRFDLISREVILTFYECLTDFVFVRATGP